MDTLQTILFLAGFPVGIIAILLWKRHNRKMVWVLLAVGVAEALLLKITTLIPSSSFFLSLGVTLADFYISLLCAVVPFIVVTFISMLRYKRGHKAATKTP